MDAVILANYFHEHAPYAIKCFEKNIHVFSECISNGTMAEGVELLRAYEKSNSVYLAMEAAKKDAEMYKNARVPNHLKNHPTGYNDGHGKYKYPHDFGGYVKQQYLPDSLKDRVYYTPSNNGREANLIKKKDRFKK